MERMHVTTTTRRARRRVALLATTVAALAIGAALAIVHALDADAPRLPFVSVVERAIEPSPGLDDGVLPDGPVSPYADLPAMANLDPDLLSAVRAASDAAAAEGIELVVNSGWRSESLQQRMLDDAVETYGSQEEASRWVSTPERSAHVTGDAVDIGDWDAASWLGIEGRAFGLCQTYANEPWHFELRPDAVADGCPQMLDDPTQGH